MNINETPLFDALVKHANQRPFSFHVPGHKNGTLFLDEGLTYFQNILQLDLTELTGLDDLHQPEGPILQAEELTSKLYGVRKSFFLVNGSTVGNLAMILSTCKPNDTILVQRNCHKSIINGLKLAGANPIFLAPEFDETVKVPTYVSYETVKLAVEKYPETRGVVLTSPNYYGMANEKELSKIITFLHAHKIPVLVDEAHGAHFILDGFPVSAISLGADVVIHSAHKTLPAMTMGSFLHVNGTLINDKDIHQYLKMLQSSSPSYPIMASLDLAKSYLYSLKLSDIPQRILEDIDVFYKSLQGISQLTPVVSKNEGIQTDPLKLTLKSNCEDNGFQLQSRLEQVGIYTEMADPNNVLVVLPLAMLTEQNEIIKRIEDAVKGRKVIDKSTIDTWHDSVKISSLHICYNEFKNYNKRLVPFMEAIGEISGEMIIPYPPGIPLLMEGERITKEHLEIMVTYIENGARFQGGDLENRRLTILTK